MQFRITTPRYFGKLNLASVSSKAFFFGHKTAGFYPKLRAKSVVLRVVNEKVDGIDLGATNSAMEGGKPNAEFFLNMLKNDGPVTGLLFDAHLTLEEICALV